MKKYGFYNEVTEECLGTIFANSIEEAQKRAIELKKPFALLIRLEHLGGINAFNLLANLNFKLIIPKKRINYITPKMKQGIKVGGNPFHSIWLTYKVNLPKQINYMELSKITLHSQQGKVGDTHETSDMQRSSGKDFVQSHEESVKPADTNNQGDKK